MLWAVTPCLSWPGQLSGRVFLFGSALLTLSCSAFRLSHFSGRGATERSCSARRKSRFAGSETYARARAEAFSQELLGFLADWDNNDPTRYIVHARHEDEGMSDDDRSQRWQQETQASIQHFAEKMNHYLVTYSVAALALFDEFHARGLCTEDDRRVFEHPTNTFGVKEIAQNLGVWASQL